MNSNKFHDHGNNPKENLKLKILGKLQEKKEKKTETFTKIKKDKPIKK